MMEGVNYYVSTHQDSGPGSLREALLKLNETGSVCNTIHIAETLSALELKTPLPVICHNVAIDCKPSVIFHVANNESFTISQGKRLSVGNMEIKAIEVPPKKTKLSRKPTPKISNHGQKDLVLDDLALEPLCIEGSYQKSGTLIKKRPNTVVLLGDNDWGSTEAEFHQGRLTVKGNLAASHLTMKQGTFLNGTGTIYADLQLEGTLEPGASIGTITLVGDQIFSSGSHLVVELDPLRCDVVLIDGQLQILPGANISFAPSGIRSSLYTILEASEGIIGTFSQVNLPSYPGLKLSVVYDAQKIQLLAETALVGQTYNTRQIAPIFNAISSQADLAAVIQELVNFTSQADLEAALYQIGPSVFKGFALLQESNAIRIRMTDEQRMAQITQPLCANSRDFNLWTDVLGNFYHQDKEANEPGFNGETMGVTLGFDYCGWANYFMGTSASYTHSHVSWKPDYTHGDINSGYGSLYGGWYNHLFYADLTMQGSYNHYQASRHIKFANLDRRAKSSFSGYDFLTHLEWGANLTALELIWTPYLSTEYQYLHQNSFEEAFADSLNLAVESSNYQMLRSEVGINFAHCFALPKYSVWLKGKLSYIREDRFTGEKYTAQFVGTDTTFTSKGLNPNRNLFSPGFSLGVVSPEERLRISLKFDAELDGSYWDQNLSWQFDLKF